MREAVDAAEAAFPADAELVRNGLGNLAVLNAEDEFLGWVNVLWPEACRAST